MIRKRKPYLVRAKGRVYFRQTWTENGVQRERRILIPFPEDSAEFDRRYWEIRSGRAGQTPAPTNMEALIQEYRVSRKHYGRLAPGTKRKYDAVLERLREASGDVDVRRITRKQVRAIHEKYADTPRKADHQLQVLRILLNFAKRELEWIAHNPADGVQLFGTQKEWEPWPERLQGAFVSACQALGDHTMLTAFYLGTGTGQRPGDLCGMKWEHYDGESIAVRQDKTDERIWVACPQFLKNHLDTTPKRGEYILAKNLREPIGYDGLERRFRKVRAEAGANAKGYVMHGWRFTAAVALAEAGCSDAEIAAVTGHKTLDMVQKYRKRAQQRKLSKQAQGRRT